MLHGSRKMLQTCQLMTIEKVAHILKELHGHKLTLVYFLILAYLQKHGGSSMTIIRKEIGYTGSAATGTVDYLENRGLVVRRDDAKDRRLILLYLTPKGSNLLAKISEFISKQAS